MKTILFYSVSVILILTGCKTVQNTDKETDKKVQAEMAVQAIKDKNFVLEADYLTSKYGRNIYVSSSTNFISVNGNKATIQLAVSAQHSGPNGIGGITLDGTVSNAKISTDKKGNINYSMNVQGVGVSATVTISMPNGTNKCTATVTPNFNSNRITFSGYLYPRSESSIFKGRAL